MEQLVSPLASEPASEPPAVFVSVVAGDAHSCARRSDGRVYCWGANDFGQVGADSALPRRVHPTMVRGLEGAVALAAADVHTCAIVEGGAVLCWGRDEGVFGRADGRARGRLSAVPVEVPLEEPAVELVTCDRHACVRHEDGTVTCWGRISIVDPSISPRAEGRFGPAEIVEPAQGRIPGLSDAMGLACRGDVTCALRSAGRVTCWGGIDEGAPAPASSVPEPSNPLPPRESTTRETVGISDFVSCSTEGCWATAGDEVKQRESAEPPRYGDEARGAELRAAATRGLHACVAPLDGPLRCWAIGMDSGRWASVGGVSAVSVAVGSAHGCAVDARGQVVCFGADEHGQLGRGSWSADAPEPIMMAGPTGLVELLAPTRNTERVLAVAEDGRIHEWGPGLPAFVLEAPFDAASVTMNDEELCVVAATGQVRCIGAAEATRPDVARAWRTISGIDPMVEVDAGGHHMCALSRAGEVWCWGDGAKGALGDGTTTTPRRPVKALGSARTVAAGDAHSCALRQDGRVLCWGKGSHGRLGDGASTSRLVPTQVPIDDGVDLAVGKDTTCVAHADGGVSCWGRPLVGRADEPFPTRVAGVVGAVQVEVGCQHACAVSATGGVQCWGSNRHGELGDPHFDHAEVPTTVEKLPPVDRLALGCGVSCASPRGGSAYCWGAVAGRLPPRTFDPQPLPIAALR